MMQQVETVLWDTIAQTEQESQKPVHLDTSPMPQEIQILLDVNYVQKDITVRVQELAHQQDLVMAVIIVQKDRTSVLQHPISVHQDITVPLEVLYRYHVYQELIRISMDRQHAKLVHKATIVMVLYKTIHSVPMEYRTQHHVNQATIVQLVPNSLLSLVVPMVHSVTSII